MSVFTNEAVPTRDGADLKFVSEPLLSQDSDNLFRKFEPKAAYIFSERCS
jgi:hypothetical protein